MTSSNHLLDAVHDSVAAYCRAQHNFGFNEKNPVVRLHEPTFGADEINAALDCMLTTHVTMGPKVKQFEREFAREELAEKLADESRDDLSAGIDCE